MSNTNRICCRRIRPSTRPRRTSTFGAVFQERDRDPLDPNQQLTAPQWWAQTGVHGQLAANNSSPFAGSWPPAASLGGSGGVQVFEYFFHRLTEPVPLGSSRPGLYWDRSGSFSRRAYYSKFLILSGGRDKQPGRVSLRRFRYEAAWGQARLRT